MRELLQQDFEIAAVKDAKAAPRLPTIGDGHMAALINCGILTLWSQVMMPSGPSNNLLI